MIKEGLLEGQERRMGKAKICVKTRDSIDYPSPQEVSKSQLMDKIKIIQAKKKSCSSSKWKDHSVQNGKTILYIKRTLPKE